MLGPYHSMRETNNYVCHVSKFMQFHTHKEGVLKDVNMILD